MEYEEAKSLFVYDTIEGVLRWKSDLSPAGRPETGKSGKTYIRVRYGGRNYAAHRLIALLVNRKNPAGEIDHHDGDGTNNLWTNLRITDRRGNARNQRLFASNTSGHPGVYWVKARSKWIANIRDNKGNRIFLGIFENKEDAINARKYAEDELGYHKNHGTIRPLEPQTDRRWHGPSTISLGVHQHCRLPLSAWDQSNPRYVSHQGSEARRLERNCDQRHQQTGPGFPRRFVQHRVSVRTLLWRAGHRA